MNADKYLRVEVEFTLTLQSDMHIGDGDSQAFYERGSAEMLVRHNLEGDPTEFKGEFSSVIVDIDKHPYIPGSALRGWLRQNCEDAALQKTFFGGQDGERFDAGALRVADARLSAAVPANDNLPYFDKKRGTAIAHGVAIDAVTGAAAEHKLFRWEYVPKHTTFKGSVRLQPPAITGCVFRSQIQQLIELLHKLDGGDEAALGAKLSAGMGRICISDIQVMGVQLRQAQQKLDKLERQPITGLDIEGTKPAVTQQSIALLLQFDAPFLINEAARRPPGGRPDDQPKANQNFQRDENGNAKIPGTSLRGLARGHAEKILRTKLVALGETIDDANKIVKQESAKLFGTERQRSLLFFTDAIAATTQPHAQTFNAIDRFTGGVAHGKLFSAQAVAPCTATFTVRATAALADWQKGWLLWLARDAAEGMLSIGWGKGKGFGAFLLRESRAEHKFQSRWWAPGQAWLQAFDDEVVKLSLKPDQINTSFGVSHE